MGSRSVQSILKGHAMQMGARTKYPRTDTGWAAYLATGMELILASRTVDDAHLIAKERLNAVANSRAGISRISGELRQRWLAAAGGPENPEFEQGILDSKEER